MENAENVRDLVRGLQGSIDDLETSILPILGQSLEDLTRDCQLPREEADVLNKYLYCTVSVAFAYLKALGVNTEGHPIMKELDRVKASMKRLKDLDAAHKKTEDTEAQNQKDAAEYVQRTLGGASGGAAASSSMKSPAISSSNFQGKHTKFEDAEDSEHEEPDAPKASSALKATSAPLASSKDAPSKSSNISKQPKGTKKKFHNKVNKPQPKGQKKGNQQKK